MPRPALRSRSLIRKKVRRPGGVQVTHYTRRRPGPAHCASCQGLLSGMPRLRPAQLGKIPRSQRRPNRPYGGELCSSCTRETIKERFL